MIACIIESGVKEGRDDDRKRLADREIFSHYNVKIAAIERETDWTAPVPSMA